MKIYSIAEEFGPFYCEKAHFLNFLRGSYFWGSAASLIFAVVSDKFGRRTMLMISCPLIFLGAIILTFSTNIWMACSGLFIIGVGCSGSYKMTVLLIT